MCFVVIGSIGIGVWAKENELPTLEIGLFGELPGPKGVALGKVFNTVE